MKFKIGDMVEVIGGEYKYYCPKGTIGEIVYMLPEFGRYDINVGDSSFSFKEHELKLVEDKDLVDQDELEIKVGYIKNPTLADLKIALDVVEKFKDTLY